jgi:hypothetical protein
MKKFLEELNLEPVDKLRRYNSNWLRQATRMNSSRMAKIVLNYGPKGRRSLKRPLDEAETGLSRPNW